LIHTEDTPPEIRALLADLADEEGDEEGDEERVAAKIVNYIFF